MLSIASRRAFSDNVLWWWAATATAIRFHCTPPLSSQKNAICVCCAVRVELDRLPKDFTSLKSEAYCALVNAGGPGGRAQDGEGIANGTIVAICWNTAVRKSGGVGRHWPGAVPPTYGGKAALNPSALRQARMSSATAWPQATPRATCSASSPSSSSESSSSAAS